MIRSQDGTDIGLLASGKTACGMEATLS